MSCCDSKTSDGQGSGNGDAQFVSITTSGDATIGGNETVGGNLNVTGSISGVISTTHITLSDSTNQVRTSAGTSLDLVQSNTTTPTFNFKNSAGNTTSSILSTGVVQASESLAGTVQSVQTNTSAGATAESGYQATNDTTDTMDFVMTGSGNADPKKGIIRTSTNANLDINAQGALKKIRLMSNSTSRAEVTDTAFTLTVPGIAAGVPTTSLGFATKGYVDALVSTIAFKATCLYSSTVAYTATYANGAAGVGATLTNNTTQAAISVDSVTPSVADRILIKNQASTFQNGIYVVTVVGTGATNWVLTRATDYDQFTEINPGDVISVQLGTLNTGTAWLETATVTVMGTSPILFSQFVYNQSNVAITGGTIDNTPIGNSTKAAGSFTTLVNTTAAGSSLNAATIGATTPGSGAFTSVSANAGATVSAGNVNISAGNVIATNSTNGVANSTIANTNAGTAAAASFLATNDAGNIMSTGVLSSGWTAIPSYPANTGVMVTTGGVGIIIDAQGASKTLNLMTNTTSRALLTDTGVNAAIIGVTTPAAANFTTVGVTTQGTGKFTTVESTVATGTAPLTVASTTNVTNLNASSLSGKTFASPAAIGTGTPASGAFTTISSTGQYTNTLAIGTAPMVITSTTNVANLNASSLSGATFAAPGTIGGGTPAGASFTTLNNTTAAGSAINAASLGVTNAGTVAATTLNNTTAAGSAINAASLGATNAGTVAATTLNNTTAAGSAINAASLGATNAGTGAFTTLNNTTAAGSAANFATIGVTSAGTGKFTTVESTQTTGSAPFIVASTTNVTNLNASTLSGATFSAPGAIGGGTPAAGAFTTISSTGQYTNTLAIGTAPLVITSTTNVANLNASSLSGATFAAPGTIGAGTPGAANFSSVGVTTQGTGKFTTVESTQATGTSPFTVASTTNVANLNASSLSGATFAAPGAIGGGTASAGNFTTIDASAAAGLTPFTLSSTDAGATAGPIIDNFRNSASPAVSDIIGQYNFNGNSSNGTKRTYASISGNIITATNTSEDGSLTFGTQSAGTLATRATINKNGLDNTVIGAGTPLAANFTTIGASGTSTLAVVSGTTGSFTTRIAWKSGAENIAAAGVSTVDIGTVAALTSYIVAVTSDNQAALNGLFYLASGNSGTTVVTNITATGCTCTIVSTNIRITNTTGVLRGCYMSTNKTY